MKNQIQALLPIKGLDKLFPEATSELISVEVKVRAAVIDFSEFKKTRECRLTDVKKASNNVYEHAKKFTSHYKVFG